MREAAAVEGAGTHLDVAAEDDREHKPVTQRCIAVDDMRKQLDQHRRALRVPDEHDRTAVVLLREVVVEAREQALVGNLLVGADRERRMREERRERYLPVHRCEHAALGREARCLCDRDGGLGALHLQVAVRRQFRAHRRIDVEAVEPRLGCRLGVGHGPTARGRDDSRREGRRAGVIGDHRLAEPHRLRAARVRTAHSYGDDEPHRGTEKQPLPNR